MTIKNGFFCILYNFRIQILCSTERRTLALPQDQKARLIPPIQKVRFLPSNQNYIKMIILIYCNLCDIQGVRFVRDQTKSDDRLGQTKKKSSLPFCKIRNNY